MTTQAKKFIISFMKSEKSKKAPATFLERAKRHFVKTKNGVNRDLSDKVDEIVYCI